MKLIRSIRVLVLVVCAVLCLVAPFELAAQGLGESTSRSLWSRLEDGKLSFSDWYRFEAFERDGAPFTATAYAPTLRLALGYETPSFHGFTAIAGEEGSSRFFCPWKVSEWLSLGDWRHG